MSIVVDNVSKRFGDKLVLQDLNFSVKTGTCFCLLGRNGAGKSTLINILADLLRPDTGMISLGGYSYDGNELAIKRTLGVLPDVNPAIPEFTGLEYLRFVGALHKISREEATKRAKSLAAYFTESEDILYKRIQTYSRGMKQMIALSAALLHQPTYLLLDEPFAGLDPVASAQLVELIRTYRTNDVAILLSSHDLAYVEQVATHVGVLDEAKLRFVGTYDAFTAQAQSRLEKPLLEVLQPPSADKRELGWLL